MSLHEEIEVRSVQVWKGGISPEMVDKDGELADFSNDLTFQKEKSISFECDCGKRFRKWSTAAEHLASETADSRPEEER